MSVTISDIISEDGPSSVEEAEFRLKIYDLDLRLITGIADAQKEVIEWAVDGLPATLAVMGTSLKKFPLLEKIPFLGRYSTLVKAVVTGSVAVASGQFLRKIEDRLIENIDIEQNKTNQDAANRILGDLNSLIAKQLSGSQSLRAKSESLTKLRSDFLVFFDKYREINPTVALIIIAAIDNIDRAQDGLQKANPKIETMVKDLSKKPVKKELPKLDVKQLRENDEILKPYGKTNADLSPEANVALYAIIDPYQKNILKYQTNYDYMILPSQILVPLGGALKSPILTNIGYVGQKIAEVYKGIGFAYSAQAAGYGMTSLLVLNPLAAAAVAGLSLASMILNKGNGEAEFRRVLLNEIQSIKQQIQDLFKSMCLHFDQVYRNQEMIYTAMLQGFDSVERLIKQEFYDLKELFADHLRNLKHDMQNMEAVTKLELDNLFLQSYEELSYNVESYLTGGSSERPEKEKLDQFIQNNWVIQLEHWAIQGSSSSQVNGLNYLKVYKAGGDNVEWTIRTLTSPIKRMDHLLGFLVGYAKSYLVGDSWLQGVQPQTIINPVIWVAVCEQYVETRRLLFRNNYQYDTKGNQIKRIMQSGVDVLSFIEFLQTDPTIYNKLISLYEEAVKETEAAFSDFAVKKFKGGQKARNDQLRQHLKKQGISQYQDSDIKTFRGVKEKPALEFERVLQGNIKLMQERIEQILKELEDQNEVLKQVLIKFDPIADIDTLEAESIKGPINAVAYHGSEAQLKGRTDYLFYQKISHEGYHIGLDCSHIVSNAIVHIPKFLLIAERLNLLRFDIYFRSTPLCGDETLEVQYELYIDVIDHENKRTPIASVEAKNPNPNAPALGKELSRVGFAVTPFGAGNVARIRLQNMVTIIKTFPTTYAQNFKLVISPADLNLLKQKITVEILKYKTQIVADFSPESTDSLETKRILKKLDSSRHLLITYAELAGFSADELNLSSLWTEHKARDHWRRQEKLFAFQMNITPFLLGKEGPVEQVRAAISAKIQSAHADPFKSAIAGKIIFVWHQLYFLAESLGIDLSQFPVLKLPVPKVPESTFEPHAPVLVDRFRALEEELNRQRRENARLVDMLSPWQKEYLRAHPLAASRAENSSSSSSSLSSSSSGAAPPR